MYIFIHKRFKYYYCAKIYRNAEIWAEVLKLTKVKERGSLWMF